MARKIALLIGMSEYSSLELDNLPQAEKDADELYSVLVDPNLGDFPEKNIKLLKSPNKREMELKIDWLFDDRKKDDLLLLYFAGHGVLDHKDHLYLTATDTSMKDDGRLNTSTAIDSDYLIKCIKDSNAERKVIILDAYYSGAIDQSLIGRGNTRVKLDNSFGGKGAAILESSKDKYYSPKTKTDCKSLAQSDDISGCYEWLNQFTIEVFPNGTAFQFANKETGKWRVNETEKYKFTFTWSYSWRQDVNFFPDGTVEGLNTEPSGKSYEFSAFKLK
jgi:Caspase domain